MNFEFTPQQEQVRETIARFATEEMAPLVRDAEENEAFPRELFHKWAELGLLGVRYPEAYITTNTRDDRVHPGHARKFAAKLEAMGVPYLYYEQTFGGHANDADPELNARRWARHYVYLAQKLMD